MTLPTREGLATGHANERQMLDAVIDPNSFTTRIANNADGSVTRLRTRGGMPEFVTIPTGSGSAVVDVKLKCTLNVESGIVDMFGVGESDENANLPGLLVRTDYVSEKVGDNTVIAAGPINLPEMLPGKLPADSQNAASFTAGLGYSLQEKKITAWRVTSSMFTGRMRLYVQALYGSTRKDIILRNGGATRPALSITTVFDESNNIQPVTLGTGSGLYLDPLTKEHWVIEPTYDKVYFFKLIGSLCAEALRIKWRDGGYSADEAERIETYILANSLPSLPTLQIIDIDVTPNEAMGYGWHFNWDGDRCDIVDVAEIFMPINSCYGFRSTHYRLSFTLDLSHGWLVTKEVVSGPEEWTIGKNSHPIAYPDWFSGGLVKAGNIPSGFTSSTQNGVVYCFYARNDLKVVNYSGSPSAHDASLESSPQYFAGSKYGASFRPFTISGSGGHSLSRDSTTGYTSLFSCDGVQVGGDASTTAIVEYEYTWAGRTDNGGGTVEGAGGDFDYGYPTSIVPTYDTSGTTASLTTTYAKLPNITGGYIYKNAIDRWGISTKTYTDTKGVNTLVVIPFGDAEAVYLYGHVITSHTGDDVTADLALSIGFSAYGPIGGTATDVYREHNGNISGGDIVTSTGTNPILTESYSYQGTQLVCSHGIFGATTPDVSPFFSTLPEVTQLWGTTTSVNGVITAPAMGINEGSPIYPFFSSIVGWA